MSHRDRTLRVGIGVALAAAVATILPQAAFARACGTPNTPGATAMLKQINHARANAGMKSLRPAPRVVPVARRHSVRMVRAGRIWHDNLRWSRGARGAQNVGGGPTVGAVLRAMMRSPTHRAAILDRRHSRVAIGVARGCGNGTMVAVNFVG